MAWALLGPGSGSALQLLLGKTEPGASGHFLPLGSVQKALLLGVLWPPCSSGGSELPARLWHGPVRVCACAWSLCVHGACVCVVLCVHGAMCVHSAPAMPPLQ